MSGFPGNEAESISLSASVYKWPSIIPKYQLSSRINIPKQPEGLSLGTVWYKLGIWIHMEIINMTKECVAAFIGLHSVIQNISHRIEIVETLPNWSGHF